MQQLYKCASGSPNPDMASHKTVYTKSGSGLWALRKKALLFAVHIKVPDFLQTHMYMIGLASGYALYCSYVQGIWRNGGPLCIERPILQVGSIGVCHSQGYYRR